jgi:hypothetical protein
MLQVSHLPARLECLVIFFTVPKIINKSLQRIHIDEIFHRTRILQAVNAMLEVIMMTATVTNSWSLVGRSCEFAMLSTPKYQ